MGLLGQTGLAGELEASHQNDREDQEAGRVETLERSAVRCDCRFRERYKIRGICGELVELLGRRESQESIENRVGTYRIYELAPNYRTRHMICHMQRKEKARTICIELLTGLLVVGSHLGCIVFMVRVEILWLMLSLSPLGTNCERKSFRGLV